MSGDKRKAERLDHLAAMRSAMCGCELCERASIYEFDAGMSRVTAEKLAAGEVMPAELAELEREVGSLRAAAQNGQGGRR